LFGILHLKIIELLLERNHQGMILVEVKMMILEVVALMLMISNRQLSK
jgi:hypothetical protein